VGDVEQKQQRLKPKLYDAKVSKALVQIWLLLDYLCGKRLVAILAGDRRAGQGRQMKRYFLIVPSILKKQLSSLYSNPPFQ
jgi:hypothetical protein